MNNKEKEILERNLLKCRMILNVPIESVTKEQRKELMDYCLKNAMLSIETAKLIRVVTQEEFLNINGCLYGKLEMMELLRGISKQNKLVDSNLIDKALKYYKVKETAPSEFYANNEKYESQDFYYRPKFIEFLKQELKDKKKRSEINGYLEEGVDFVRFKDKDEYEEKMKKWRLDSSKETFEAELYYGTKEVKIIGFNKWDKIAVELKPNYYLLLGNHQIK